MTRRAAQPLLALVAVVALAACNGGETSSPDPTPTPEPRQPRTGECYDLSTQDALAPVTDATPVRCERRHTARTLHVGRLAAVAGEPSPAVDGPRVQERLARDCEPRLADFLGGTPESRDLSRFQVIWFGPSAEEQEAGADWFRCDVIAFGDDDRLLPLPTDQRLRGILDKPAALDTYGLCGTAQPGTPRFERVACALKHSWVAIGTIPIDGGKRFPGEAAVRRAGDQACSDQARAAQDLALEFTYGWEWPTREQWEAGQHYGFCWSPEAG